MNTSPFVVFCVWNILLVWVSCGFLMLGIYMYRSPYHCHTTSPGYFFLHTTRFAFFGPFAFRKKIRKKICPKCFE